MSVGISHVKYTNIGGGTEFGEWIADNFEECDGKTNHYYIRLEEFETKIKKTKKKFQKENREEIENMLKILNSGGWKSAEFSVDW